MLSRLAACLLAVGLLAPHRVQGQPFVPGIDVSIYQDAIDWDQVKASGVEFAIVRATRGETYDDPLFLANMRLATEAGVRVGAYHFCNLDTDTCNPRSEENTSELQSRS